MANVIEINDITQLEDYRDDWNRLLATTTDATFFHSLDWLRTYWRFYGDQQQLRVLVVTRQGRPDGILPLVVRTARKMLVGRYRSLTYPMDNWGTFFGAIGPHPARTLAAALKYVRSRPRDWDAIDLPWCYEEEAHNCPTNRALRGAGFRASRWHTDTVALADLRSDWDAYFGSRTSKWRNNYRRCEKKLATVGNVEFVRYRPQGETYGDNDPRFDLYDACEQVARLSWQGSSTTGTTLSHNSIRDFVRDMHQTAVNCAAADLCLLYVDGQPAAFLYNYHYRRYVSGLRSGFNPRFAKAGVGTVLYARCLRDSCLRGDRIYDLGADALAAKRNFVTRLERRFQFTYFHPTLLWGPAANLKRRITQRWLNPPEDAGQPPLRAKQQVTAA